MKKVWPWILALVITAATAFHQRMTGPTYPLRGKIQLGATQIAFKLPRSHETGRDCPVEIHIQDPAIRGILQYKRHKTADPWNELPMWREGERLVGDLPSQPPAGKLAYRVILSHGEGNVSLTGERPVVIRFKGSVPSWILLLHVLVMFLAMLFSARAGIEALRPGSNPRSLALWTTGLLLAGGFVLGPLVQKFAFGSLWTGFPFGYDLTDNKTLIAFVGWLAAVIAGRQGKPARGWVLAAAVLLLVVFLIPHSLLGSELDYEDLQAPASQATVLRLPIPPPVLMGKESLPERCRSGARAPHGGISSTQIFSFA